MACPCGLSQERVLDVAKNHNVPLVKGFCRNPFTKPDGTTGICGKPLGQHYLEQAKKENRLDTFKIDCVNVVHWESGITKTVVLNESVEDLLSSFAMGCRQAFPDDLANSKFNIYALAHNYNHDDISDRQRILTSAALQEVLLEQGRFDIVPRELHVFEDTADNSSEKVPARTPDANSVASAETRDTQASLNCRAAAAYTCAFCQFHLGSNTGVAAAHIFELEHYNAIPTAEARAQALREKGLGHIHAGMNLLCLCNDCHSQFNAPYNIGINPRTSELEISGNIFTEYCNSTLFKNLVGKKVVFTKGWRAPRALLQYRYKFFEEGGKIETKKRRKKSSVDEGAVAKVQKIEVAPPAGYTVLPKLDKDPGGAGASSGSARTCVCRTAYSNGGACERCKKFYVHIRTRTQWCVRRGGGESTGEAAGRSSDAEERKRRSEAARAQLEAHKREPLPEPPLPPPPA